MAFSLEGHLWIARDAIESGLESADSQLIFIFVRFSIENAFSVFWFVWPSCVVPAARPCCAIQRRPIGRLNISPFGTSYKV